MAKQDQKACDHVTSHGMEKSGAQKQDQRAARERLRQVAATDRKKTLSMGRVLGTAATGTRVPVLQRDAIVGHA